MGDIGVVGEEKTESRLDQNAWYVCMKFANNKSDQ